MITNDIASGDYDVAVRGASDVALSVEEHNKATKEFIDGISEGLRRSNTALGRILEQCGGDLYKDQR